VATVKLLGGLRRLAPATCDIEADSVADLLRRLPLPPALLFPEGELNRDLEVLVNGRNIAFLDGVQTPLRADDRVTVFMHGARGYPGG